MINNEITIRKASVWEHGNIDEYQTFLATFDFYDNTIENVKEWEEFFSKFKGWTFEITIEAVMK